MLDEKTMIEVLRSYIDGEPENDFAHWDKRIISGWVMDARDWLQDSTSEAVLLPKQAFDGIVSLCHLYRSHPEVIHSLNATDDIRNLEMRLINEAAGETAALALSHSDGFGWERLSEKLESMILDSWESTASTGISLLEWLDSLECLRWFVDQHDIRPEKWTESCQQQWASLCEQMDECSSWMIDNAECFFETEFYLERICHTFRGDLESPKIDPSGSFAITVLRYISLLARMRELHAEEDQLEHPPVRNQASIAPGDAILTPQVMPDSTSTLRAPFVDGSAERPEHALADTPSALEKLTICLEQPNKNAAQQIEDRMVQISGSVSEPVTAVSTATTPTAITTSEHRTASRPAESTVLEKTVSARGSAPWLVTAPQRSLRKYRWLSRTSILVSTCALAVIAILAVLTLDRFSVPDARELLVAQSVFVGRGPRGAGEVLTSISVSSPRDGFASLVVIVDEEIEVYPSLSQGDGVRVTKEQGGSFGPLDFPVGTQGFSVVTETSCAHFLRSELKNPATNDKQRLRLRIEQLLFDGGHRWVAIDEWQIDEKTGDQK
jgi:hypothetical protein